MLQKGFLRNKNNINISKKRFWISAVIGLAASFSIYTFFCLFRLFFRAMEFFPVNGPLLFDASTRYSQNIGFATVALALGNAIFLGHLFRKPQKSKLPEYKRTTIINNQIFVGFNFFYVFAKFFVLGGIFLAMSSDLNAFPTYTWIFVLIALVLFLESYKSLLRQFRMKAFKVLWFNFGILTVLTFLFASTSVFNYIKMDTVLLAANPPIDLPETSFRVQPLWYDSTTIKLIYEEGKVRYQVDGEFVTLDELLVKLKNNRDPYQNKWNRKGVYLLIPKATPMQEVWELQDQLYRGGYYDLLYVSKNPKPLFTSRFDLDGIEKHLSISAYVRQVESHRLGGPSPPSGPIWPKQEFIQKLNTIRITVDEAVVISDQRLTQKDLLLFFKKEIDSTTLFYFKYDEKIPFENYMAMYGTYRQAIGELREEEAHVKRTNSWGPYFGMYGNEVKEEDYEEDQERVRAIYPIRYVENYEFEYPGSFSEEIEN